MSPWLLLVAVATLLAGLLFGYDQGVISGALALVGRDFRLSPFLLEIVTSWVTLGALAGALLAGTLADGLGRQKANVLAGVLFVIGACVQAFASGPAVLVAGRLVIGLGVGVASVAAPLYAAEMAPAAWRGRFVSTYQLAITLGIFAAYIADDLLTPSGAWRSMFGLAVIPGALLALGMLAMPETPRWLIKMGRRDQARRGLGLIMSASDADRALASIQAEVAQDRTASWREVFAPRLRRALGVGVGLAVFQQITGINAIIYYANEIFARAGFATPGAQARATLYAVGLVNVLATFIAIAFVDRVGRKPLLLAGLVGMTLSLAVVGVAFQRIGAGGGSRALGIATMLCLIVYIASFACSLGPVVWTIISEIYPNHVRGRAAALATAANWAAAFAVSQTFLSLLDLIGTAKTFWLFALFGAVAFVWIRRAVPETRGRTLEDIERAWQEGDRPPLSPVERSRPAPS